jgi:hypothetical protein
MSLSAASLCTIVGAGDLQWQGADKQVPGTV